MKRQLATHVLNYFRFFAQLQLKKFSPTIIGITGSAGKTSALQACEAVLSSRFTLKVSHKANSESGIPLNILDIHPLNYSPLDWLRMAALAPLKLLTNWRTYDMYLVEMGIDGPDEPKNMSYLLKIIKPHVGIFLNAAPTHAEAFDYLVTATDPQERRDQLVKLIAAEKGRLITALPSKGTAILNADDEVVSSFQKKTAAKILSFGASPQADIQVTSFGLKGAGTVLTVRHQTKSVFISLAKYALPDLYSPTLAAAIACGVSQGLSLEQCKTALETKFKLPPGRASLIEGLHQSTIIDSSYNSSTGPLLDMLRLLKRYPGKRKLALLGDMRELGEVTATEHQTIAKKAASVCDQIFLVGPYMKEFALSVIEKTTTPVQWFENAYQAADHLGTVLQKDDVLLVKGSQNTLLLEIAVEKLMAHPEKAEKVLCRRGKYWEKQRALLNS